MNKPHWLEIAEKEIGTKEIPGEQDNPRILEYAQATSLGAHDDETPWCSSFVNWVMAESGLILTRSAAARSWLTWGSPLGQPALGAVVVLSRPPNPASGHVGLVEGMVGAQRVAVLGGNQGNAVSVAVFPRARVLAFRWPNTVAMPTEPCPRWTGDTTGETTTA